MISFKQFLNESTDLGELDDILENAAEGTIAYVDDEGNLIEEDANGDPVEDDIFTVDNFSEIVGE